MLYKKGLDMRDRNSFLTCFITTGETIIMFLVVVDFMSKCHSPTQCIKSILFNRHNPLVATFLKFIYCIAICVLLYKAHSLLQQTTWRHFIFLSTIDELTLLYLSRYAELRHPINYHLEWLFVIYEKNFSKLNKLHLHL